MDKFCSQSSNAAKEMFSYLLANHGYRPATLVIVQYTGFLSLLNEMQPDFYLKQGLSSGPAAAQPLLHAAVVLSAAQLEDY